MGICIIQCRLRLAQTLATGPKDLLPGMRSDSLMRSSSAYMITYDVRRPTHDVAEGDGSDACLHLPDRLVFYWQSISQQRPSILDWLSVKQCFGFSLRQDLRTCEHVLPGLLKQEAESSAEEVRPPTNEVVSTNGTRTLAAAASPSKQLRTLAAATSCADGRIRGQKSECNGSKEN